jgi:hypothetical protein
MAEILRQQKQEKRLNHHNTERIPMINGRTLLCAGLGITAFLGSVQTGSANESLGFGAKIGTLGVGAEVSVALIPNTRLRSGFNFLRFSFDSTISDINYDFDTEFNSIPILFDVHPFGGTFFLSGGIVLNNNNVGVKGSVSPGSLDPEYQQYDFLADQITISGDVEFLPVAPYAGLGWRTNSNESGWGFEAELGVLFQGAPDVSKLRVNAPIDVNATPEVQLFLAEQANEIEDELSWFQYYPVASLMLTYHF